MKALIDGDILRYEIGFAAEAGWRAITGEDNAIPPWNYAEDMLLARIAAILHTTTATSYCLYLTEGRNFRFDVAVTKPYKGQRIENKPWHYKNLTAVLTHCHPSHTSNGVEADDSMAMAHVHGNTIICSRDKDLKQVPGLFYSWELGRQPSFGPALIDPIGNLQLTKQAGKQTLKGTGYAWFCGQMLIGDVADNIPGCPGVGPVKAFELLDGVKTCEELETKVTETYNNDELMLEQGQLLWLVRRLNPDGTPEIWKRGLYV